MNPVDFAARGLFYRTEDGRIIFRPWGPRGPCYLLTEQQRTIRARIQLAFYCLLLGGTALIPDLSTSSLLIYCAIAMGISYLMFWLFSRGLPKTDIPPMPSMAYRQAQVRELGQSLGKPLLWTLTIVSALFAAAGALSALVLGEWVSMLGALFFGLCTAVFVRLLRRLRTA